jgi:hypothetical protein
MSFYVSLNILLLPFFAAPYFWVVPQRYWRQLSRMVFVHTEGVAKATANRRKQSRRGSEGGWYKSSL